MIQHHVLITYFDKNGFCWDFSGKRFSFLAAHLSAVSHYCFWGKFIFCVYAVLEWISSKHDDNWCNCYNFCINQFFLFWQKFHVVLLVPLSSINKRGTNDIMNKHISVCKMLLCVVSTMATNLFCCICCLWWPLFVWRGRLWDSLI